MEMRRLDQGGAVAVRLVLHAVGFAEDGLLVHCGDAAGIVAQSTESLEGAAGKILG